MQQQRAFLIIGRSGSGKSFLVNKLVKKFRNKFVVVNDATGKSCFNSVDFSETSKLAKVGVIFEDLIDISKKQIGIIKKCLNYANHHRQVSKIKLLETQDLCL